MALEISLLIQIGIFVIIGIIIGTNFADNTIRKWFGAGKVRPWKERFPDYAPGIYFLLLIAFFACIYLVGLEPPIMYLLIFSFIAALSGMEALLEKIHMRDSVDYKFTFLIGLLKAALAVALMWVNIQLIS